MITLIMLFIYNTHNLYYKLRRNYTYTYVTNKKTGMYGT